MKKFFLSLLAMIVYSTVISAQSRSEREALDIAQTFFGQNAAFARAAKTVRKPSLTIVPNEVIQEQIKKELTAPRGGFAKKAGFYIVNDEANHRFVIVSADSQQLDILGYSTSAEFDTDHIPCGLLALLEQFNREYEYIQNGGKLMARTNRVRATKAVAPLIKTNWDQGNNDMNNVGEYVFNKFCPVDPSTGKNSLTGCVATALAQVLNYYQMPKTLPDSVISYKTEKRGISLSKKLSDIPLDWGNMSDWYKDKKSGYPATTAAQRNAVGHLMYACGLAVRMDYGSGSSSSSTYDAPYALKKFFRYNPNISYHIKDYYTDEEWTEMIQTELNSGRPIIYDGRNNDSGHAFLLVGCDDSDRYCFNWGWGGMHNDEYFPLSSITPDGDNYTNEQSMIIGISSNTVGTRQDVWYADHFKMSNTTIAVGGSATATLTKPTCWGVDANGYNSKWFGEFGIGIYDTKFQKISEKKIYSPPKGLKIWTYYDSMETTLLFDASIFKEGGQYIIAPYAKGNDASASTRMRTLYAASDYYVATVKNGTVTLELMGSITGGTPSTTVSVTGITLNTTTASLIVGQTLQLTPTVSPSNATDKSVTWTSSNTSVATVSSSGLVTAKAAGSTTVTCRANDGSGKQATCTITVTEASTTMPQMTIVSTTYKPKNLKKLTKYDIVEFDATIKNIGKAGKIRTCLAVWDEKQMHVYGTEDTREFATNVSHTIHYEVPLDFVLEGKYKVGVIYFDDWSGDNWWKYFGDKNIFDMTVNKANGIPVKSISLNHTSVTLNPNETHQLRATITPYNAKEQSVTWKSSDTSVATVSSSGLITAKNAGNATITCVANDGTERSATCRVQVLASGTPKIEWVSVTTSTENLSNLTRQSILKIRATFKNTGVEGMISTSPAIYLLNEDESVTQMLRGTEDYRTFPANAETSIDYELPLTKCPDGKLKATVTYFCNWGGKYTNYFSSKYLIDITVSSGEHKMEILSIDCDSTNFMNLTQNDVIRFHATLRSTGQEERLRSLIGLISEETGYIDWMSFADERTFPLNQKVEIDYAFPLTSVRPGRYKAGVMFNMPWKGDSWWGWSDSAFLRHIEIKEASTAIDPVYTIVEDESKAVYYDLQGRRIDKPTKRGLYIRNGKKVFVK